MLNVYPHNSPIILTDDIFVQYGGQTGTTTNAQRDAAYLVAEMQATEYIGTFLLPTIITGTYQSMGGRIVTDYGYVHRIMGAMLLYSDDGSTCNLSSESGCAFIGDDTFGYLDYRRTTQLCGCAGSRVAYQYQIAYEAGLPTGTATKPGILLALTMASTITLNEMKFPSVNEGAGDVGITEFWNMDYKEVRMRLRRTAFGMSAVSNKVAQLIDSSVRKARRTLLLR